MLGYIGVILSLVLLVFLAYRRWNVIIISLIAALIVGLTNGLGVFTILSEFYMPGLVKFMASWFLVFTVGALYSEFMTRSGSVASIAYKLVDWVGKKNLLLVIAIIALMLTVGRVSPYVQIFILWPICIVFSKESNIPREIWIPVFYVGMLAAAAFPGSPTSTNAMLVQFLGVSAASAPIYSLFHVALYFTLGMIYLRWQLKQWTNKGLGYVEHERDVKAVQVNREDCPPFITSIIPMVLVIITYSGFTGGWFGFKLNGIDAVYPAILLSCLLCLIFNFKTLKPQLKELLQKGSMGGINPTLTAAVIVGYVTVVTSSNAYGSFVSAITNLGGNPYLQAFLATATISFVCGSGMVAIPTVWQSFGAGWLTAGANPEFLRPLIQASSSPLSLGPHSGGLHGVMDFAGTNLKECYMPCVWAVLVNGVVSGLIVTIIATIAN